MTTRIAVYGTLRRGQPRHGVIAEFKQAWQGNIPGVTLHDLGPFPAVTKGKGHVFVEVYNIPDNIISVLDTIEGHPNFYRRELIETPAGEAWMYFLPNASNYPQIFGGDWVLKG